MLVRKKLQVSSFAFYSPAYSVYACTAVKGLRTVFSLLRHRIVRIPACSSRSVLAAMIAVVFWDRKEPAFANYQTWRAVGYTLVFSFHSLLCVSAKLVIALGFLVVGMVLYTAVEIHLRWKERVRVPQCHEAEAHSTRPSSPASVGQNDEKGSCPSSPSPARDCELTVGPSLGVRGEENVGSLPTLSSFLFEENDGEDGGHLTLDGTYLSQGEKAYLDHDLRRYGVFPAGGSRPLTVAALAKSSSEGNERWAEKEEGGSWKSGSSGLSNQRPARPHTWHEQHFQDQGELKVVWTKDDVFVY